MSTPPRVDAAAEFVHWATRLRFRDIPDSVIEHTKLHILDLAGAAWAGTQATGVPELIDVVTAWGGNPQHSIIGARLRASLPLAVLVNSTVARALELDDVHEKALLHPTVATVPIALGMAETAAADGRSLLTALAGNQQDIQESVLAIRVQQGLAAQTSVQSVRLAEAGITGPHDLLEGTFGWLRPTPSAGSPTTRSGRRWRQSRTPGSPHPRSIAWSCT